MGNPYDVNHMLDWMLGRLDDVVPSTGPGGREMRADCPFCIQRKGTPDSKRHLYVSRHKPAAHCFRCDWRGSWSDLIVEHDQISLVEALIILNGESLMEDYDATVRQFLLGYDPETESEADMPELPALDVQVPDGFSLLSVGTGSLIQQQAVNYLRGRGLSDDLITCGMFGLVPDKNYLIILCAYNYWQGRSMSARSRTKYLNPEQPIGGALGLWDSLHLAGRLSRLDGPVYVTEGVFSGLGVLRRGHPALALLGKTATNEQLERLARFPRPLVVMLDADAHDAAYELAITLYTRGKRDVELALLPEGDPETHWTDTRFPVSAAAYTTKYLADLLDRA